MKKVLILSGSPRKGGNSDILCDEFLRGAIDAGNQAEKIRVADKKIAMCTGCDYCRDHGGKCVYNDDMGEILQKIIDCDVLVLSSPVYFYSICAQLKAVIDRTVARWTEIGNLYRHGGGSGEGHPRHHPRLFSRLCQVYQRL